MSHSAGEVVLASACLSGQFCSAGFKHSSWVSGIMNKCHLTSTWGLAAQGSCPSTSESRMDQCQQESLRETHPEQAAK